VLLAFDLRCVHVQTFHICRPPAWWGADQGVGSLSTALIS